MSSKEMAIQLLDRIPESKMHYIIGILEGAAIPDEEPNEETLEAFKECEEMIKNGTGQHFDGDTDDLFKTLLEE